MELGQKSVIHFVSKLGATVAGFLATVYLARVLGAGTLGTYFLAIAVLTWLKMFSTMGISRAVSKRISEADDPAEFFTAGLTLQVISIILVSGLILLFRSKIAAYTGLDRIDVLLALLFVSSIFSFVTSVLIGEALPHVSGALDPLNRILRTVAQVSLVVLGFELLGLFLGYIIASAISATVGIFFIGARLEYPEKRHFVSLWSYAKFSWLGRVSGRTLASMDTIVLGIFVTSDLIGIYEIAWNIASVLAIFGVSINQTLFPEISALTSEDSEAIADLAQTGVAYSGLFLIPGLVGGAILGEVVLTVYSPEFRQGYVILILLMTARLVATYKDQFSNVIEALNKPEITFRINSVFVVLNISLNLILVYLYGWIGAAIATLLSAFVGTALGYVALIRLTEFTLPTSEISKQIISASFMGVFVYAGAEYLSYSLIPSLLLIPLGATIYFITLIGISSRFRTIIQNNIPSWL